MAKEITTVENLLEELTKDKLRPKLYYDVSKQTWYTKPLILGNTWTGGMASVQAFNSNSRTLSLLLQANIIILIINFKITNFINI